jgi:hypothetical protein
VIENDEWQKKWRYYIVCHQDDARRNENLFSKFFTSLLTRQGQDRDRREKQWRMLLNTDYDER